MDCTEALWSELVESLLFMRYLCCTSGFSASFWNNHIVVYILMLVVSVGIHSTPICRRCARFFWVIAIGNELHVNASLISHEICRGNLKKFDRTNNVIKMFFGMVCATRSVWCCLTLVFIFKTGSALHQWTWLFRWAPYPEFSAPLILLSKIRPSDMF